MIRRRFFTTLSLGLMLAGVVLTVQGFAPTHDDTPPPAPVPSSPTHSPAPTSVDEA